jgi:hypothetical protein
MYYEESKNTGKYPVKPKTVQEKMTFRQFLKKVEEATSSNSPIKYYLQESLTKEGVSEEIMNDFTKCKYMLLNCSYNI